MNSTNVRNTGSHAAVPPALAVRVRRDPSGAQATTTDVGRTLALALSLWAGAVAMAIGEGVVARLDPATVVSLAGFATLFSIGALTLDREIAGAFRRFRVGTMTAAAWLLDAVVVAGLLPLVGAPEAARAALVGTASVAMTLLFVLPVAVGLHAGLAFRPREGLSSPAATGPASRPAAP